LQFTSKDLSPGRFFIGGHGWAVGKLFHILKFRTMQMRAQNLTGAAITANDDELITGERKVAKGYQAKRTPQLWNVFVGEMSLVGPRPEDPELVTAWPNLRVMKSFLFRPVLPAPHQAFPG